MTVTTWWLFAAGVVFAAAGFVIGYAVGTWQARRILDQSDAFLVQARRTLDGAGELLERTRQALS